MSSGLASLLALALLLAGIGLIIWSLASHSRQRASVREHLQARLATAAATATPSPAAPNLHPMPALTPGDTAKGRRMPGWLLGTVTPQGLVIGLVLAVVAELTALLAGGWVSALALLPILLAGSAFFVWLRVQKARRGIVQQLPGFLDNIVRLLGIGHSMQSAFQVAVTGARTPLRARMDNVLAMTKAGMELEAALMQEAQRSRVDDLLLVASIMGMGVRYGGRSDQLLERVAHFMRDREEAEQELSALSAETRLSAWILCLLPVGVGGMIMMTNPDYFVRMWTDASGQRMVIGAALLQLTGVVLMVRLARLD